MMDGNARHALDVSNCLHTCVYAFCGVPGRDLSCMCNMDVLGQKLRHAVSRDHR